MKQPKIGFLLLPDEINGRCGWIAGLHFIKYCLYALSCLPKDVAPEIIVFIPDNFVDVEIESHHAWLSIVKIPASQLANPKQHDVIEETINSYQCDVYFPLLTIPQFILKGKWIGWIPDFQEHHLQHFFRNEDLCLRKSVNSFISSYCQKVFCISDSVRQDFNKIFPEHEHKSKTINFRAHINQAFLDKSPNAILEKYDLRGKKYIYLPNQFWVHKNHQLVFTAWNKIKNTIKDCLLVCSGATHDFRSPGYFQEILSYIDAHDLNNHVKLLGYIKREDQIQLFRGARAILQPSLFEGWNTSIEEAKSLGKFIFASNIPVHHEQCQQQGIFFNPHDANDLAHVILNHWQQLSGFDSANEKQAYQQYQNYILQFAYELLELFNEAYQADANNANMIRLPVYLQRELQLSQQICSERLELINRLDNDLQDIQKILANMHLIEPPRFPYRLTHVFRYQKQYLKDMLHFLFRRTRKSCG